MRVGEDAPSASTFSDCFGTVAEVPSLRRPHSSSSFRFSRRSTLRRSSARSHARPRLFSANTAPSSLVGRNLLSCLGVVSPRPLSLLLPLAPQGSLSDWMEEMRKVYEAEGVYPVHRDTLVKIVHQVKTGGC